jgi:Co/Zn/Cd efflux system component
VLRRSSRPENSRTDAYGLYRRAALSANVAVAVMLYAFGDGDANLRSVSRCNRNDAAGNVAVMHAAGRRSCVGAMARWM